MVCGLSTFEKAPLKLSCGPKWSKISGPRVCRIAAHLPNQPQESKHLIALYTMAAKRLVPHGRVAFGCGEPDGCEAEPHKSLHLTQVPEQPPRGGIAGLVEEALDLTWLHNPSQNSLGYTIHTEYQWK